MALNIPRTPKAINPLGPAAKPVNNPNIMAAPRIKAVSTRDYGKGGTPYSGGPDMGQRGAGIGYGGFNPTEV